MTYLKSLLRGSAFSMISGFKLSSESYNAALKLLKECFDNKQLQIGIHLKNLLKNLTVSDLKNISQLRCVYHNIENQIRSLDNLNVTPKTYRPSLIPVLQPKLLSELNLVNSGRFSDLDYRDITEVLKVFKEELSAREKTFSPELDNPNYSASSLFKANFEKDSGISCLFCTKSHKTQSCKVVTHVKTRKNIIKNKRRCFVCLKGGHISKNCTNKIQYYKCSKRHHIAFYKIIKCIQVTILFLQRIKFYFKLQLQL